uniref:Putative mitochondrial protein n=1 Tax=Tanacetum cinerariifolium TaxID=118510 RepID=A0A699GI05_TANCI|nr:putative mitochondrial protein [Tanacetum cinerariifolium]
MPRHKCGGQMYALEVSPCEEEGELAEHKFEHCKTVEFTKRGHELLMSECYPNDYSNPHISLKALSGISTFNTMRIKENMEKHLLHLLMDTGSTHNLLDIYTTKKLGCKLSNTYHVMANVMLLPLGGCEMVLGIQWLSTFEAQKAFETLQQAMTKAPVLALLNCNEEFIIEMMLQEKENRWLGADDELGIALVTHFHASTICGHSGVHATFKRLGDFFYWKGTRKMVKEAVRTCDVCQRNKADLSSYHGLLQPLPILTQVWKDISIDFIDSLPS